jgi:small-conductance mechanosensitive channel
MKLFIKNTKNNLWVLIAKYWRMPLLLSVLVIAADILLPSYIKKMHIYVHGLKIVTISLVVLLIIQTVRTGRDIIVSRNRKNFNTLRSRRIHTQASILVKIAVQILFVIWLILVLMTFPEIHKLGVSILASAGIAGVILGFAAQKSLGNLLAGFQIAFTQPIKIGDKVVVENEGGVIKEITLTYVVINTPDKRMFIVPINYFIEKPFQNWTRNSSDLFGVVYLEVDYSTPVQKLREVLDQILEETDLWDRKVKTLQVTNAKAHSIEIRILASAIDHDKAWDLRCYIREKLISFLQKEYPRCLPRLRVSFERLN